MRCDGHGMVGWWDGEGKREWKADNDICLVECRGRMRKLDRLYRPRQQLDRQLIRRRPGSVPVPCGTFITRSLGLIDSLIMVVDS